MQITNRVKEALAHGSVTGLFVMTGEPALVEILGHAGFDYVLLDTEHGPNDIRAIEHMIRAAEVSGCVPFVRVTKNDAGLILRALDVGAKGVVVPQVNDAAEARAAVRAARYAPNGDRGIAGVVRAAKYGFVPMGGYLEQSNRAVMVFTQVEHVEAVRNLDEILAVEGLDGIYIGPTDLSQTMGITGQFDDPKLRETIEDIIVRARRAGKVVGLFCLNAADAKFWHEKGVNFITVGTDTMLFAAGARRLASQLGL